MTEVALLVEFAKALSRWRPLSYRNQSKSMDWFLYDNGLRHERVNCIVHDLLLAKLSAYGFDYSSVKLVVSFLNGRKFRTKIHSSFSLYLNLLVGIPQGSILGPSAVPNLKNC